MARSTILLLTMMLLAAALRLPGMAHDFWLDEVWSYLLVREYVTTPLEIVTRLHIDNNHPLNSWFLYVLGEHAHWWVYRLPSFVFGVLSVGVAARIMRRRGVPHALAAALLVGCSYPLIVYASEARGYAAMVLFMLVSVDAHERYLATSHPRFLVLFWASAVLGFASHLTFLHAYLALLSWTTYVSLRGSDNSPPSVVVALHALPLTFLAAFYSVYIRHLIVAGAEPASLSSVIAETVSIVVGVPWRAAATGMAAVIAVAIVIEGLRIVWRTDRGLFLFFIAAMLVMPALMIAVESRTALVEPRFFPRYFLVSITLFLLLFAWVFGEHYHRGPMRAIAVHAILGVVVAGNLWQAALFARQGRGQYLAAMDLLARETGAADIRVSSNSDFRTSRLLAFYRRYLPPTKRLTFFPSSAAGSVVIDWRILEDVEPRIAMPLEIVDQHGTRFRLMQRFSFYGLSGAQWTVYHRVSDVAPANRPSS